MLCLFAFCHAVELIGVTLVHEMTEVSGVQLRDTSSIYCVVCSLPKFTEGLWSENKGGRDSGGLRLSRLDQSCPL